MALAAAGALAAAVVAGWIGRSVAGSTRAAIVAAIARAHQVRAAVRRTAAEQVVRVEDLLAEGRARYASRARGAGKR